MSGAHDARLVPAAMVAYVVTGATAAEASAPWIVAGLAILAALALLAWTVRGRGSGGGRGSGIEASVLLAATIGIALTAVTHAQVASRWEGGVEPHLDGESVLIRGTVAREPQPLASLSFGGEQRARVPVEVGAWADECDCEPPRWFYARARITVMGEGEWLDLDYGDQVVAVVSMSPTTYGGDVAVAWEATVVSRSPGVGLVSAVASLREGFRGATADLPDEVRGLTRGMVIGDTTAMPQSQVQAMRVTGLAHLTAVSGAHFAIVMLATAGVLRALRWPRRVSAVVAAVVMAGFATLVFPDPSVVRALAMALAVCAALWWGRPARALPALCAGVIVLVAINPYLTHSFGFALSVVAVTAIVVWAPILAVHLQRWLAPGLAKAMAVPFAAQTACAPILVLLNPGIGAYTVFANVIAVLFAVPVTLLGLLSVVIGPLSPALASTVAELAGLAAWPVAWSADAFAHAPGAWLAWPEGWVGAALMAIVSATVVAATVARRADAWVRTAAVIALAGVMLSIPAVRQPIGLDGATLADWQVVFCDVGQGDMMMLRAADSSAVVVDVGQSGLGGAECLADYGVTHIPLLILTHPHADHDGAVSEIASRIAIDNVWVSPDGLEPGRDGAVSVLEQFGTEVSVPRTGDRVTVGEVAVEVLHAPGLASDGSGSGLNDGSIVVHARAGHISVLALGDLEAGGQQTLSRQLPGEVTVDIVKVAHHGSADQDANFVTSIRASLAVVSVGEGNRHGHPAQSALDLYGHSGTPVLRTDECGDIALGYANTLVLATGCGHLVAG